MALSVSAVDEQFQYYFVMTACGQLAHSIMRPRCKLFLENICCRILCKHTNKGKDYKCNPHNKWKTSTWSLCTGLIHFQTEEQERKLKKCLCRKKINWTEKIACIFRPLFVWGFVNVNGHNLGTFKAVAWSH